MAGKKSIFDRAILSSKVKSANVKPFPEMLFGYFAGPLFALVPNAIINTFLTQYWKNVLGLQEWAYAFTWLLPLISTIIIVIGNLLVGKLMEGKPRKAGKARPLLVLSIPIIALAMVTMFLAPYPGSAYETLSQSPNIWTLVVTAIGYNLFYAIAWPIYFTSHSAMVNLSTRSTSQRSLLGTAAMAAQSAAAGFAGMFGGFLADILRLTPSGENEAYQLKDAAGAIVKDAQGNPVVDQALLSQARESANGRWMIVMAIMVALLIVGVFLEFYFTRERITEENFAVTMDTQKAAAAPEPAKKVAIKDQIRVCVHDKYWWMIMLFFFLYQLGGMLKNNGQNFYSEAWTGQLSLSSTIGLAGAIPTALGMVIAWPLAMKFGKARCIRIGAWFVVILGMVGFIPTFIPSLLEGQASEITGAIYGFSIAGFCLKAIGTVPAMYVSLALLSDVLDHQEAVHGFRTDGFSMALYGSIMIAMTGVANAIILGVDGAFLGTSKRVANTVLFFGGEMLCYLLIGAIFLFMKVEKFTEIDHNAIEERRKQEAEAAGVPYLSSAERLQKEELEAEKQAFDSGLEELKAKCVAKGLDFEKEKAEFIRKDEEKKAKKQEQDAAKKAKEEKAKADAEAKQQAYLASLNGEQRKAYDEKQAKRAAKVEAERAALLAEFQQEQQKAQRKGA